MAGKLLLGDEAVAQAALDAGISGCYAYPGTPSTEIMEYIQKSGRARERGVHAQWSANEKCAMEEALGLSYAGKRALVCMKHVGLNVAADAFMNSAITGTVGGIVVAVADDPSMHSSQNEQDSRFYAEFAQVPCLEPGNQQEAYDMVRFGLDYSEAQQIPVMVRLVTRLAHSRADIRTVAERAENSVRLAADRQRFILLPMNARRAYEHLLDKQDEFRRCSEESPYNRLRPGSDRSLGIVACGIADNYLLEAYGDEPCPHPVLKLAQYPLPAAPLRELLDTCEELLILEDGAPFVETRLKGPLGRGNVRGRLSGDLPRTGELSPAVVARALGREAAAAYEASALLRPRPPRLCAGCPHIASYEALLAAMDGTPKGHVLSDIGCYTLGALPPFEAISSCVDMGASISMAKGAADAGLRPAVAVIGDSTFTHSGITPLLDAVWENTPITVLILDNDTTAMTGGQDSVGQGKLQQIVLGLGVAPERVHMMEPIPARHDENVALLRREIYEIDDVSVIIARRACIQTRRRGAGK